MKEDDEKLEQLLDEVEILHDHEKELKEQIRPLGIELAKVRSGIKEAKNAIHNFKHKGVDIPFVSDHAIVRFLERVDGIDIDAIRIRIRDHVQSVKAKEGNIVVTVNPKKRRVKGVL